MRLFTSPTMHAHSADASVESFFNSMKSWRTKRVKDSLARPPKKRKRFFPVTWKNSAIRFKDGNLILSNGRITEPLILKEWSHDIPVLIVLRFNGEKYELIFTFKEDVPEFVDNGNVEAIDIGQIHIAACSDGTIVNGRLLRSVKQWRHKKLADLTAKMSRKKKGSVRHKKLKERKRRLLKKSSNKIKDILHKVTTGLVATLKDKNVSTLVIGDLCGFRQGNDIGSRRNQENHSWMFQKILWHLQYKSQRLGMKCALQEESYTSQTCPQCGNRKKQSGRVYDCKLCNFSGHRDLVGAVNILRKYLGTFESPVVTEMAPVAHVRYKSHMRVAQGFVSCGAGTHCLVGNVER